MQPRSAKYLRSDTAVFGPKARLMWLLLVLVLKVFELLVLVMEVLLLVVISLEYKLGFR